MNKLSRFLIKMIFIILIWLLLIAIFKVTGLRATLLMLFLLFLGKTSNYGSLTEVVNSGLEDYYSLLNLNQDIKKDELQSAYNNEIDKLNNNHSISIENRLHLMGILNDAFDTLNNPQAKSEYDNKYKMFLEEKNALKQKTSELNKNIGTYINGLLKYNFSPFINFKIKSKDTIGLVVCLILDLLFILPYLSK